MHNENALTKGHVRIVVTDEDGNERVYEHENLVVTTGRNFIASRMVGASSTVMSHMAVGTGTTAAAIGDTTLGTEAGRVALTVPGGSVAANVVTYSASFPAGTGTGALTEAGVLNAAAAGTMLNRVVFPVVNKAAGDSITITWTVTIS